MNCSETLYRNKNSRHILRMQRPCMSGKRESNPRPSAAPRIYRPRSDVALPGQVSGKLELPDIIQRLPEVSESFASFVSIHIIYYFCDLNVIRKNGNIKSHRKNTDNFCICKK